MHKFAIILILVTAASSALADEIAPQDVSLEEYILATPPLDLKGIKSSDDEELSKLQRAVDITDKKKTIFENVRAAAQAAAEAQRFDSSRKYIDEPIEQPKEAAISPISPTAHAPVLRGFRGDIALMSFGNSMREIRSHQVFQGKRYNVQPGKSVSAVDIKSGEIETYTFAESIYHSSKRELSDDE